VTTPSGNVVEAPKAGTGNSEGQMGTIVAGTSLVLTAGQQVCTNTNHVGDRITATLSEAVTASNGAVLPVGATAVLEVTGVKSSQQAGDNMIIELVPRSISYGGKTYPINGEITSAQTQKVQASNNDATKKVLGGAAVGAILGRIFSGKSKTKGTIIGAAGGAAAGAVLAHQTAKYDACIPSGGHITVRLDQAMQIQAVGSTGGSGGI
jgi:outer membrane lipoprotein SlyB